MSRLTPRMLMSCAFLLATSAVQAQTDLGIARYDETGALLYPTDTTTWVHAGSSIGGTYGEETFDPANPGNIGIVLMEPTAHAWFLEHGDYADGTMFLLTFYNPLSKTQPQLRGLAQGMEAGREIHVIDNARFTEGHAFFLYRNAEQTSSTKVPDGSDCVSCHNAEGGFRSTFTQFYPHMRERLQAGE